MRFTETGQVYLGNFTMICKGIKGSDRTTLIERSTTIIKQPHLKVTS